jgi:hypothetical protein
MFVVVDPKAKQRAGERVWFTGTSILLALYVTTDGGRVLAGEVDDRHEDAVRAFVKSHPHYREAREAELVTLAVVGERPTPAQLAPVEAPTTDILRSMAMRLGWSVNDISGTAIGGQPGEGGGRSPATGLTLAEMTLSSPPKYWSEAFDQAYPWELSDWRPPGPGWKPPSVPSKRGPPTEPDDGPTDPTIPDPPDEDTEDEDDDLSEEDPKPPAEPVSAPKAPEPPEKPTAPDGQDPAVAAGYPAEHVAEARKAAFELKEKRGTYSYQALNYVLGKLSLPTVNAAQLEALLGP